MIKYRKGYDIDYIRLIELIDESGSDVETEDFRKLVRIVENSAIVLTAWDFDYMIGFVRADLDGNSVLISNVLVDYEYRDKDIGKNMIDSIISCYPGCDYALKADREDGSFYESLGFKSAGDRSGLYHKL